MNQSGIIETRLKRQGLASPLNRDDYDALFRAMSPVHTLYWTEPGSPPLLQRRAAFDDLAYNNQRRAQRLILKGRYQNGSVGYVDRRDLELYACAYRKTIEAYSFEEIRMLEILDRDGSLTIGGVKQATGMLVKKITPILHRLQQACLVFEEQANSEDVRLWYAFERVFPEIDLQKYERVDAIGQLIKRFLPLAVMAEADGIKSFYGFSVRDTKAALERLLAEAAILSIVVNGRTFYFMPEDEALVRGESDNVNFTGRAENNEEDGVLPPDSINFARKKENITADGVFLLHRSDFWVKTEEYELKHRFNQKGVDILYYIVIDGQISGAVMGRFKFGPDLLEDVVTDLPEEEGVARREEILAAIYEIFDRDQSPVQRYHGEPLP